MGCADGLALAAPQAIGKRICDRANIALLHDETLRAHQPKGWRVGIAQVCALEQLARIEMLVWVHLLLVVGKSLAFGWGEKGEFCDANAMFAGNNTIEFDGNLHDAGHGGMGLLQHLVVV